jgi:hypothetical protein
MMNVAFNNDQEHLLLPYFVYTALVVVYICKLCCDYYRWYRATLWPDMLHCPAVVGLSGNDEIAPTNAIHTYLKAWSHHTTTAATAPAIGATTATSWASTKQLPVLSATTADSQADGTSSSMEVLWWENFCHGRALFHKKSLHNFMKRLDDQAQVFKLNLPYTTSTAAVTVSTTAVVVSDEEEYIELQQIEVKSSHGMSLDLHDDIDDDWLDLGTVTASNVTSDTVTATATAACTPTRDDSSISISSSSVHDTRSAAAAAVALHDDWQSDNCQDNDSSSDQQYCKCEHASRCATDSLCSGGCMKSGDNISGAVSKQRVNRDRSRSRTRQVTTSVSPIRQVVSAQ